MMTFGFGTAALGAAQLGGDVLRRDLFRIMGAAGIASGAHAHKFPADYNASKELARADWKPAFLDDHQDETLIILSELIIPRTDTPGAKEALVNRFIDRLLAAESEDRQREFLESLAGLDGEAMARHHSAFRYVPQENQVELLGYLAYPHSLGTWGDAERAEIPGHKHFLLLKDWITRAFYSSEVGMRELGYDGPSHGVFEGCTS